MVSPSQEDLERLLRAATPTPRGGYVESLERSLELTPRRRGPSLAVVAGIACAIAALAVVIRCRMSRR